MQQRAASPSVLRPAGHKGHALGNYMPEAQQPVNRSWSGGVQPGQSILHRSQQLSSESNGQAGFASAATRVDMLCHCWDSGDLV